MKIICHPPPLSSSLSFLSSFFTQFSLTLKHTLSTSYPRRYQIPPYFLTPGLIQSYLQLLSCHVLIFSFLFYLLFSPIAVASFLVRFSSLSRFSFSWSKTNKHCQVAGVRCYYFCFLLGSCDTTRSER